MRAVGGSVVPTGELLPGGLPGRAGVWYNGTIPPYVGTQAGERRTTVEDSLGIQHWMVLAFLFFLDIVVLGCLFLIAMNKIYLLP